MRFLKVLAIFALALCVTASVYAETQSVKVSGDITIRGIARDAYSYLGSPLERTSGNTRVGTSSNHQDWAMTVAEVEVDADLTDNVQTVIRLLNQRDWNVGTKSIAQTTPVSSAASPFGRNGYTANANEFDVELDLAYITLKNFIYSPLTVTVGRQDLWFGRGFIVGLNQQSPTASLSAAEYTGLNAFDSVKAVLDYDPLALTFVYSNIQNNAIADDDGVNLYGLNAGYKFDQYKGEAEAYWFYKRDQQIEHWSAIDDGNDVHTLGLRGSFDPIDVVTIALEGAWQTGSYLASREQDTSRGRNAFALDIYGELRYFADKAAWKPKVAAEYILYSGNKPEDNVNAANRPYTGWDGMYRGKFDSAIREFVGKFYTTYDYPIRGDRYYQNLDASSTNQHQLVFLGWVQPMDSLLLKANYNIFWTVEPILNPNYVQTAGGGLQQTDYYGMIGQEVDLQATWDYTDDVSFSLLGAFFVPGQDVYYNANSTATDVVGSVKVSF